MGTLTQNEIYLLVITRAIIEYGLVSIVSSANQFILFYYFTPVKILLFIQFATSIAQNLYFFMQLECYYCTNMILRISQYMISFSPVPVWKQQPISKKVPYKAYN